MAVFRVEKSSNYTTMSNYHLQDKTLSLKAKGLLSQILSLPDNWDYSVAGLVKICKEGKDCIVTVLQELEQAGYITRRQQRTADGKLAGMEYIIYERPHETAPCPASPYAEKPDAAKPHTGKPSAAKPHTGKPSAENPPQLNTKQSSTKEIKDLKSERARHAYGAYHNVLLSDEEADALRQEFPADYRERIERLSEYIASTGKHYKNHLATLRSWARTDKAKTPARQYSVQNYTFSEGESL